jgi:hypothetical protein
MAPTTASAATSTFGDGLDRFEGVNAAEWEEVPESQSSAEQLEITPTRRLEFSKIENEKVRLSSYLQGRIYSILIGR